MTLTVASAVPGRHQLADGPHRRALEAGAEGSGASFQPGQHAVRIDYPPQSAQLLSQLCDTLPWHIASPQCFESCGVDKYLYGDMETHALTVPICCPAPARSSQERGQCTPAVTRVMAPCREAFDHVVDRSLALVAFLKAQDPAAVHNMDNLLLMESMDVIGMSPAGRSITFTYFCRASPVPDGTPSWHAAWHAHRARRMSLTLSESTNVMDASPGLCITLVYSGKECGLALDT